MKFKKGDKLRVIGLNHTGYEYNYCPIGTIVLVASISRIPGNADIYLVTTKERGNILYGFKAEALQSLGIRFPEPEDEWKDMGL